MIRTTGLGNAPQAGSPQGIEIFVTGGTGYIQSVTRNPSSAYTPLNLIGNPAYFTGGNVGIGTTSPGATLHVVADVTRQLYLSGTDTTKVMKIGYNLGNNTCVVEGFYGAGSVPLLLNPSGGNVGIGTTTPGAGVDVVGSCSQNNYYANGDPANGALFLQDTGGGVNSGGLLLFGVGQGFFAGFKGLLQNGTGPAGDLCFMTRNTSGNIVERMRVTYLGNVGIGTTSPNQALHVVGNCNITGQYQVNGVAISGGITTQTQPGYAAGTVYQNTTGKPQFHTITCTPNSGQAVRVYSDSSNPPGTQVAYAGAGGNTLSISFWVLPGNYFEAIISGTTQIWFVWY